MKSLFVAYLIALRYDVTDPPYYGEVQRQLRDGRWKSSTAFTQSDIAESRVRYLHNSSVARPGNDYFRYRVHAMEETTQEFEFFIRVTPVKVDLVTNHRLVLLGMKETGVTNDQLRGVSTLVSHNSDDVVFALISVPLRGDLIRLDGYDKVLLTSGATFTQRDIDTARLSYRLRRTPPADEELTDSFQFRLSIPNYISEIYSFAIEYQPSTSEARFVNNELQTVSEGGLGQITSDYLYIELPNFSEYRYTVTSLPEHGTLQLMNPSGGGGVVAAGMDGFLDAITEFTNSDIREGRLYYRHDDTETTEDKFDFRAVPVIADDVTANNTFVGRFDIRISLENDNPPVRIVHKVVNVVRNHGKLLTSNDIRYIDPDTDFDSADLMYNVDSIENGHIVLFTNQQEVLENFTQSQLDDGVVFFKHSGPRYGRSVLRISDGKYVTNGSLEVRASEPFIRIINNTGLEVSRGQSVPIGAMNLSLESNLYVNDTDIEFQLLTAPMYGAILQVDGAHRRPVTMFNMRHIKSGSLVYQHDGSDALEDSFHYRVSIFESEVESQVTVRIVPDSATDIPPQVEVNRVLIVDDTSSSVISSELLRVTHPDTPASDVVFTITRWPAHGQLSLRPDTTQRRRLFTFTQDDVNRNRLEYRHKDQGAAQDSFSFDVSNGVTALSGLNFRIRSVPLTIAFTAHNFSVGEGQRYLLNTDTLDVSESQYLETDIYYIIVRAPVNGWLIDAANPKVEMTQFSHELLTSDQIYYKHNGNDSTSDHFTLLVKSRVSDKQSQPRTAHVTVIPDNDESPQVSVGIVNRSVSGRCRSVSSRW